jgi:excisionase family DNA binding protein
MLHPHLLDPPALTVAQVAERLQVTRQAVAKLIESRRLRALKIKGETRIASSALRTFIDGETDPANAVQTALEKAAKA